MIPRLNPGLWYPLPTLHERRCRHPCKARFRLAGCAFTGRGSNPLDRDERFQVTSVLLSRTYPDASWAHTRRKFYEVHVATKAPLAEEALRRIAALYAIEADIRGQSAEDRRLARQQRSKPLVEAMHAWLTEQLNRVSGRSGLAQAMRYALNHWAGLILFLEDGRLELDTNTVERAIRPVVLTRKNALFAGSDRGGERAAAMYSLIVTAKLNDVDPRAWLADVLARIADHPTSRLDELLPWHWADRAPAARAA